MSYIIYACMYIVMYIYIYIYIYIMLFLFELIPFIPLRNSNLYVLFCIRTNL